MYTTAFTPTPKCTNWLATTSPLPSPPPTDSTPPLDRFLAAKSRALEQITPQCVPELQYALRARGLPVSGLRKDLLERLAEDRAREATQLDSPLRVEPPELRWLDRLRVPELKEMCRKRDLPVGGLKADLKERLVGGF